VIIPIEMSANNTQMRILIACDCMGCQAKTAQSIWILNTDLFQNSDKSSKASETRKRNKKIKTLLDCEDFKKQGKHHFCASCQDRAKVVAEQILMFPLGPEGRGRYVDSRKPRKARAA
jgi:hypothetical protein